MTCQEFILTIESYEVAINVDIDTGDTLDVYKYANDDLHFYNEHDQKRVLKWRAGKNKLFKHLKVEDYPKFIQYLNYEWTEKYMSEDDLDEFDPEGNSPVRENPIIQACLNR